MVLHHKNNTFIQPKYKQNFLSIPFTKLLVNFIVNHNRNEKMGQSLPTDIYIKTLKKSINFIRFLCDFLRVEIGLTMSKPLQY